MKSHSAFITHDVLTETQDRLKKELLANQKDVKEELSKRMDKGESTMDKLGDKVDDLQVMVIPLLASMEATAKNTERLVVSFDEFAKSQNTKNDNLISKVNEHEVKIETVTHIVNAVSDKKKYNAGIVVAAIGVIGLVVTGIFNLAPIVIPLILD